MPDAAKPATAFDPAPLIEAAKKATPGPWFKYDSGFSREDAPGISANDRSIVLWGDHEDPNDDCGVLGNSIEEGQNNATHIAASNPAAILAWAERDADQQARITTDAARIQALEAALKDCQQQMARPEIVKTIAKGLDKLDLASMKVLLAFGRASDNARALLEPGR